jgi:hypothetical protein
MPDSHAGRPLNWLAQLAIASATEAVRTYLDRLFAMLISMDGFVYRQAVNRSEELRYQWVAETSKAMDANIGMIIARIKQESVADLAPMFRQLTANGQMLFAKYVNVNALFNTTWDAKTWATINSERDKLGLHLSGRLWDISRDATEQALALIEKASREGIPFGKIKAQLTSLLTEQGRANMEYNVRRLWADQLRRNRIIAQREVWLRLGYVKEILLSRSFTADETCRECGEAVGPHALDTRVVPVDWENIPPYHPWCQCEARPAQATAAELRGFLDSRESEP